MRASLYICVSVLHYIGTQSEDLSTVKVLLIPGGFYYWPFQGDGPGVTLILSGFEAFHVKACLVLCSLGFSVLLSNVITSFKEER